MADLHRAYAILHVKKLDTATRQFSGFATTPELDRQNHILDPQGASFRNPLPLLFHHDVQKPVGRATLAPATEAGIAYDATMPTIAEAGPLKDRIDEAWQSIKAGLITGVSIGFRVLDDGIELLENGGLLFTKTEIVELSLVTIPANASATVLTVKSLAATGHLPVPAPRDVTARQDRRMPPTTAEQITSAEASRSAKAGRMVALMTSAAEGGTTLDAPQREEYDTLDGEVKGLDEHLTRLRRLESLVIQKAVPVPATATGDPVGGVRGNRIEIVTKTLPKGTAFVRACMALAASKGDRWQAIEIAKQQWHDSTPEVELFLKAAATPGTTTDPSWAGPLVVVRNMASEFIELLRPATILGKIPGLRTVPFNVSVPIQTAGGSYGWVGQGAPKPITQLQFGQVTLGFAKVAGIIVLTVELVRFSDPSAEAEVQRDMIAGIAQFLDQQFLDPAVAAVANVNPASITNGTVAIASTGDVLKDLHLLLATFTAANVKLDNLTVIMSPDNALTLAMTLNGLGQPMFPNMSATGGSIFGFTVLTSKAAGGNVIMLAPEYILYADDGQVAIDISMEASVQMDTAPDNPALATTVMTSLWQNNLVGLRAERFVNWKRAILPAVKYVSAATYVPAAAGLSTEPPSDQGRLRNGRKAE